MASNSAACGSGEPGSTISSPVENSATRTRRRTVSLVNPTAAASATCCAASRLPAGSTTAPARTSSPASRRLAPDLRPGGTITRAFILAGILLHEHRVGALRHRRAGEDADRLARRQPPRRRMARGHAVDDRQPGLAGGIKIAVAHRVTVDCGIVERRQVDRRDHVARHHAPVCVGNRHLLGLLHRRHAFADQPFDLVDRHERAGERETVVGELRHHVSSRSVDLKRRGVFEQNFGDALDIVEADNRQRRGERPVRGNGDDARVVGIDAAACRSRHGELRVWDAPRACSPRQ